MKCACISVVVGVLVVLGGIFPRYTQQDDEDMLARFNTIRNEITHNGSFAFPVMSFNMRLDALESDPENHYTKRIFRIRDLFERWNPYIIGLQEPFAGQLLHLQSVIPKHYKEIGFNRNSHDLGHPSRHNDFNVAILYNDKVLKLKESDYIWLSKTPRVDNSKDWGSIGIRALNMARFRLIGSDGEEGDLDIIVFNTHLDRWGEVARRKQAELALEMMKEFQAKYPHAVCFQLGDFNAAPGQGAHDTLTSHLTDSWIWCEQNSHHCDTNQFSSTFHGWNGALVNTYLARVVQYLVFMAHGTGFENVFHFLRKGSGFNSQWSDFKEAFSSQVQPISEALPTFPRMHVDWILYHKGTGHTYNTFDPRFVSVVDVRSGNYSSDHFPVVALFELNFNPTSVISLD